MDTRVLLDFDTGEAGVALLGGCVPQPGARRHALRDLGMARLNGAHAAAQSTGGLTFEPPMECVGCAHAEPAACASRCACTRAASYAAFVRPWLIGCQLQCGVDQTAGTASFHPQTHSVTARCKACETAYESASFGQVKVELAHFNHSALAKLNTRTKSRATASAATHAAAIATQ